MTNEFDTLGRLLDELAGDLGAESCTCDPPDLCPRHKVAAARQALDTALQEARHRFGDIGQAAERAARAADYAHEAVTDTGRAAREAAASAVKAEEYLNTLLDDPEASDPD
ncbi:MAG: hypothetical protein QF797_05900 [Alphaproteobacteria bacterium]|jgi:hypothetical protein|nr:hypothetical protein [Rhodospirillaceae bacterium]MDP6404719.1 hypothetical protein [Alphaproteobacteria bacterium]MDP6622701.1 hypothetical protein [Alphaproteobacteria bacterium]|tara:strand:- start:184 stop:516 length:333 start_codon:yes stop_codon:yes gene_type:complete